MDHLKVVEGLDCKAVRVTDPEKLREPFAEAHELLERFRVPVVVEVIPEEVTDISMGTETEQCGGVRGAGRARRGRAQRHRTARPTRRRPPAPDQDRRTDVRIVVAPDKFKGSLEASEVAAALEAGIHGVDPAAEVVRLPVADGGEGTLEAALGAGFSSVPATVAGPVGEPVEAEFALRDRTAVVEMALASGLAALPVDAHGEPLLDAGGATSRGTGELVRAALDAGAERVVLGVGGSACTDGGAGLLQALGARLLDAAGEDLGRGGAALARLARVDLAGLDPRVASTEFVLASDVDHPLLGEHGAAAVFGPQKGAGPEQVAELDAALTVLRDRLADALGEPALRAADAPGAGAAGGVGDAALAVLGAQRRPGVQVVLEFVGLARQLDGADVVVTGEGSLDEQSLGGKTPLGVLDTARSAGVPAVAVCGRTTLEPSVLQDAGFLRTYALSDLEPDPRVSMREAGRLLELVGAQLARDLPGLPGTTDPAADDERGQLRRDAR